MGMFQLLFTVLAFNGPLAIIVGYITVVIGMGNGLGAPMAYIACGILIWVFAAGFTRMAHHLQNPGGFYAFVTAGLGKPAGLAASFLALASYYFILLGATAYSGLLMQQLVSGTLHGPHIPWWVWMSVWVTITATFGYLKLDLSARVLTYLLAGEIVIAGIYAGCVTAKGGAEGLSFNSFTPQMAMSGSIGLALLFAIMNFGGFEATAIYREEVKDPDRTIPRATNIFIITVTVLFAISAWVIIQALGPSHAVAAAAANPTGVVSDTIGQFVGRWAQLVVSILVNTSVFAGILASHNIASRYVYNLSVDGILPRRLANVHGRHGSPHRSSVAVSIATVVGLAPFILFNANPLVLYAQLSGVYGYSFILLLLLTTVAVFCWLRRQTLPGVTAWHRTIAPALAGIGLCGVLWLTTTNFKLLLGSSSELAYITMGGVFATGLSGVAVALLLKRKRPHVYQRIGRQ